MQLAQYDKAEADFEKAYELNPNQSLSTAAQGLAAVQANDLDHALGVDSGKTQAETERPAPVVLAGRCALAKRRGSRYA